MLSTERFFSLRRVQALAVSPDGTWAAVQVARQDAEGKKFVSDLWRVPLDGGAPVRLTWGDNAKNVSPAFRRDGALAFLSNRNPRAAKPEDGDDERLQVWVFPAGGGDPVPLTDEPLGVSSFAFSSRADRLLVETDVLPQVPHEEQRKTHAERSKKGPSALLYTQMPVRYWDHWLSPAVQHLVAYDANGENRRDLMPNAPAPRRSEISYALSPDGRFAVFARGRIGEARLFTDEVVLLDIEAGTERVLVPEVSLAECGNFVFSPDSQRLAFTRHSSTHEAVGKPELLVVDIASGALSVVAPHWDAWPHIAAWSEDGLALLASADNFGEVPVFWIDLATGQSSRLNATPGVYEGLALSSRGEVVGIRHTHVCPPEPFAMKAEIGSEPRALASLSGFTEEEGRALADAEALWTKAPDGGEIHSYWLTPKGAEQPGPTLLFIHGGPIGSFHNGWHWRWNPLVFVSQGYRVCCPNPRGSTGYGQAFIEGIWGNQWGAACYRDLMAVTDALEARPEVDKTRIVAMGGSFGGYMTNWIGGNTERFKALITHASLFHLSAFAAMTDMPAYWYMQQRSGPYSPDADRYSPHTKIDQWKTPTLIIHGEKDYRVPVGEALALFEALQWKGVTSELLIYPDENHWILKPRNGKNWYDSILSFLGRHAS
jgi:dipeptidyl aminopeptidase/acylaminoacyl peptidase